MDDQGRMLYDAVLMGSYYQTSEKGIIKSDYITLKTGAVQIDVTDKYPINKAIYERAIDDRAVLSTLRTNAWNFIDSLYGG